MKLFQCTNCDQPVFFENTACERCNHLLGYISTEDQMWSLDPALGHWSINGNEFTYCQNHQHKVCNWLVPLRNDPSFCIACSLNRTIPDLSIAENYGRWVKLEIAKHRLIYSLLKLSLPLESKLDYPAGGLCFDFLSANEPASSGQKIMTGHDDGVITIVLAEADSVSREQIRSSLNEPYRTLIGHFRHEVGHYYWQRIIADDENSLANFRAFFGDERKSYAGALQQHYANGAPKDWRKYFISEYASSHPWEDWAETWAHYMHIINTMETAWSFGLKGEAKLKNADHMSIDALDPYSGLKFTAILEESIALFYAVNSINRSMGIPDVYPFVISDAVIPKLEFIHKIMVTFKANNSRRDMK